MTDKKDVTRLSGVAQRGENAKVLMRQLTPMIEDLQQRYYKELVINTRTNKDIDDSTVYKMIALDDLIQELSTAGRRGDAASATLEKQRLANTGGSDA